MQAFGHRHDPVNKVLKNLAAAVLIADALYLFMLRGIYIIMDRDKKKPSFAQDAGS